MGIVGAVALREAILLDVRYHTLLARLPELRPAFAAAGVGDFVAAAAWVGGVAAMLLGTVSVVGLSFRGRLVLNLVRKACIAAWMAAWFHAMLVFRAVGVVQDLDIKPGGTAPDSWNAAAWKLQFLWPVLLVAAALGLVYLFAWTRAAIRAWTRDPSEEPAAGDRVIENVRNHGPDPRFRKSVWASVWVHIFFVLILPWLLSYVGCVDPYRVPKGRGSPAVAVARVQKVERQKKKKKLMVNPNSAISFNFPDLNDSKVERIVEQVSRVQYNADPSRVMAAAGKMGAGGEGPGGWPDGMEDSKVRFIRLEYNGQGWDDGMDAVSRADMNFLAKFRNLTGFNCATKGESHPIRLLRKYPEGYAPPFVYMTGSGGISVSDSDKRILREYLHGGGMLFADCGSRSWDTSFRTFIASVLPGEPLMTIPDDDVLFQLPFGFANGPPPLWHHGGVDSMGVKHNGRWVVFYHPGDVNDAWKVNRSGMREDLAEGAMEIGVNVVYYSFTHYLELTRKYRR
jgi:hypothetical protein